MLNLIFFNIDLVRAFTTLLLFELLVRIYSVNTNYSYIKYCFFFYFRSKIILKCKINYNSKITKDDAIVYNSNKKVICQHDDNKGK